MATLAQGTFSVKRLTNGKTLNFVLVPNKPTTQIFTPDPPTYAPNYETGTFLTITPALYISGEVSDQIMHLKKAPTWTINNLVDLTSFNAIKSSVSPYTLTIKKNLSSEYQYQVTCKAIYVEPITLTEIPVTGNITFTKVTNAGTSIRASLYAPEGSIFKNKQSDTLLAHCDMYRGSSIDTTNVKYQWSILSGNTWTDLTAGNPQGTSGFTTNELSIPASLVLNTAILKCVCTDTDPSSSTFNINTSDTISFVDMSDPYTVDVFTPGGDTVMPGGSTEIQFMIRQSNTYLTAPDFTATKTIKVYRYTSNMILDTTWGTNGYKVATLNSGTGKYALVIHENTDFLTGHITNFGFQMEG